MDRVNWTEQVSGKNVCFQGSHFVCVGEGRVVVMVVCGGRSVNEVCMEVTGCGV